MLVTFLHYFVTFYDKNLQFRNVFSLACNFYNKNLQISDGVNEYFQVCEFSSEFHNHFTSF